MTAPLDAIVVVLEAPRQIALRREAIDPDALGANALLCETLVSAISPGTELAAYVGAPPLRDGVAYPRLQGYCNVARVLRAGAEVRDVAVGDRILSFTSHRSHFAIDRADVLASVPPGADAAHVACAYLFHLGYNAVLRGGVRAGSRVVVVGLGTLGLTSTAMAALAGAEVHAVSEQPHARRIAADFGARGTHARDERDELRAALGAAGADVVIVTTNGWDDWALALDLAGPRATVAVLGFPGRSESPGSFNPLDSRSFYAKQLRIEAVGHSPERADGRGFARFNERANLQYLVEQIARGRLDASALVSGRYPGAAIEQAYRDLLAHKNSPVTYALEWNHE